MKERSAMFTEIDSRILDSHRSVLDGPAACPGGGYKIVLHNLHDSDHSVTKIINDHYAGRREGSPTTDLVLSMLVEIEERPDTSYTTYFNRSQKSAPPKSTIIVIHNHDRMAIGLLCINLYMNTSAFQFLQSMIPPTAQTPDSPVEENYAENVNESIVRAVTEANQKVQNDSVIPNANRNKEIVSILYQGGIFNLKDTVIGIAGLMGISKNIAYMHVRNLSRDRRRLEPI